MSPRPDTYNFIESVNQARIDSVPFFKHRTHAGPPPAPVLADWHGAHSGNHCSGDRCGRDLCQCRSVATAPWLTALPPLTGEEEAISARLHGHGSEVASLPHNIEHYLELERAACYIQRTLLSSGLSPELQEYLVACHLMRNIEIAFTAQPAKANPCTLVIGAHYDSDGASPGTNDNTTGVAALLEVARALALEKNAFTPRHNIHLVFFVNEELPYGKTDAMGSLNHARAMQERGERVLGMTALETIGHVTSAPESQHYPVPFGLIYPDRGNFFAFVGLHGSRRILTHCLKAFHATTAFPSIGSVAPGFNPGIDLSDHQAYHHCGFPAFMITDTAAFRNPNYHTTTDLTDTVDYQSLARITAGLTRMILHVTA